MKVLLQDFYISTTHKKIFLKVSVVPQQLEYNLKTKEENTAIW